MQGEKDITYLAKKTVLQQKINQAWRRSESEAVQELLDFAKLSDVQENKIQKLAYQLSKALREQKAQSGKSGVVQGLLQEFSLSSEEGIALMCLAEALLRIPDKDTRDLLIKDKIHQGNWKEHVGQSRLMFVNAAAWGLMFTGKLLETSNNKNFSSVLTGILARCGRGVIRKAVDVAMRIMGEQFVTGESIQQALDHARNLEQKGFRYSYDMLGEAAFTEQDAQRYMNDYINAIHAIGKVAAGKGVYNSPGISIKLSAIHPRYQRSQYDRVHTQLYDRVLELALLAKQYDIGLNIDAEETERLELSLELLERLCFEPELKDWNGIGFVIQAYQKRCYFVVDCIIDLAKRSQHRLMIRLVKGAYWDSEIKKAQIDGMSDYPVYTRKVHTDLSYIACAKKLLAEPEAIYPQFATHNAHSLATIYHLADPEKYYPDQYEFQCLHGMGEPLYANVVGSCEEGKLGVPCRIYAPVGNHETLLAYLVRRLLENGANSSFVNRIADENLDIQDLIRSPAQDIAINAEKDGYIGLKNHKIPYPKDIYLLGRKNSQGFDLTDDSCLLQLNQVVQQYAQHTWQSSPLVAGDTIETEGSPQAILNPANHQDLVGAVFEASARQIQLALQNAQQHQPEWQAQPVTLRAKCLEHAADIMESRLLELMVLLCRESGKTYANAIAEVREAVDFLRYYAQHAQSLTHPENIKGLGVVLCISPWNFPLAIFSGQIAAALVTGNSVLAKPAEQTSLIAFQAVKILHEAGIPESILQLLPGRGETVGAALSQHDMVNGIMFTGSTEVARILQKTVAQRLTFDGQPVTLIAETGGQNAMIVDSSALTEQVVFDVINSAFDSAGQRCSALRILCVQEDCADTVIKMLKGAMQQLRVGNPDKLQTDIGPVIDHEALQNIEKHIQTMQTKGYPVYQGTFNETNNLENIAQQGTFVLPTLIELPDLNDLQREIFGPVLHLVRYKAGQIEALLQQINAKGYGLTMGLHTRIDQTIQQVIDHANVGNLYINRNIVGAVVGVQPFGGEGLSGTGPKAGGPLYLYKLMRGYVATGLTQPFAVKAIYKNQNTEALANYHKFKQWLEQYMPELNDRVIHPFMIDTVYELQGPTGESNQYVIMPREKVLSIASNEAEQAYQLLAIFAVNAKALIASDSHFIQKYQQSLPKEIRQAIDVVKNPLTEKFDAVLHHGTTDHLIVLQQAVFSHQKAIVGITHLSDYADIPLERLVIEHAISINTAAAGGNASLMTMSE
ncbi:trifunctional transcriptional regulator/proline dehydrogenase/L-glutamate gamma-semialdehyde dehydrogenase [Acinetobacter qingfengensis]|uniref:Bifunctional protein PutA n=1 Tax=Acinetobacter qingfengensis TaxID=1262585 RepID=A0A1E7RCX8_9GAMM|nr:trifunctional transcriptional regulator/proline dehydrogenase/L-glutamate gamma-semialdehyde dehydrogenase [Acinetobacter qingfengensis]